MALVSRRRALNLDQPGFPHSRPRDPLRPRRSFRPLERRNLDRLSGFRRLVERLDDSHILQAFLARWFRYAVLQDAIREVQQFGGELVALADALARRLAVDRQLVGQTFRVLVRGIDANADPWCRRYDRTPTSAALKLVTNAATRPPSNRSSAPVDSSISASLAAPLLTEIARLRSAPPGTDTARR